MNRNRGGGKIEREVWDHNMTRPKLSLFTALSCFWALTDCLKWANNFIHDSFAFHPKTSEFFVIEIPK